MKNKLKKVFYYGFIILALIGSTVNLNPAIRIRESFGFDPMSLIVIISLFCLFKERKNKTVGNNKKVIIILGILLALMHLLGRGLYLFANLDFLLLRVGCFIKCLLKFCFYSYLYTNIVTFVYDFFDKQKSEDKKNIWLLSANKKAFLVRMLIMLVLYLPYFLREFPGAISTDSVVEMDQAFNSLGALENHHPVFHIYLIALTVRLGRAIFHSVNAGVAVYSIIQMLATTATFSYVISFLDKQKTSNAIKIISFVFFALYPPCAYYSFTMWKDIPFTLSMIFLTAQVIKMFVEKDYLDKKINVVKILFISLLVVLFRNNGIYVILLTFLSYLLFYKKNRKQTGFIFVFVLIFYLLFKGPVFTVLNIKDGPTREALSVPLQQIARVYVKKKDVISEKELETLHAYILNEDIEGSYTPLISDNIKNTFNEELFKQNKKDLAVLWLRLFAKEPVLYFESYFIGSMGYWYPEVYYWVVIDFYNQDEADSVGYVKQPLIKYEEIDEMKRMVNSRKIPVVSILFSTGFFFWMVLVLLGYVLYKKKNVLVFVFMPILTLWLTVSASPIWCEYRYIFAIFATFPLLLAVTLTQCKSKKS